MRIIQEFKTFAMRGNAIDLAIGVVIGAAFSGIVNSLVSDIINPPLGFMLGGLDFSNFFITLYGDRTVTTLKDAQEAGVVTLNYGLFINALVKFVIVAAALFLVVKQINRFLRTDTQSSAAQAPPPEDILLLREIRDSLKR